MLRTNPASRRIVVTGVGFQEQPGVSGVGSVFTTPEVKPNIGAAIALEAARNGYSVVIVARTGSKLERVRASIMESIPTAEITTRSADLLNPQSVQELVASIPTSREIDLVHSAGMSAGDYRLPKDNPYLALEETPLDLPTIEFEAVVKTLLITVQAFLPRWKTQERTGLVVVSSMSAIRAIPYGFSHTAAKAGLHQAVRSLTLELNQLGITISEVLPGMVNTGHYDNGDTDRAVRKISRSFGYDYGDELLPQMSPEDVAAAVLLCLTSGAHILSIAMVARGQLPHLGA